MMNFEKSNKDEFEKFIIYYLHQKILKHKLIITRKLKQFQKKIWSLDTELQSKKRLNRQVHTFLGFCLTLHRFSSISEFLCICYYELFEFQNP